MSHPDHEPGTDHDHIRAGRDPHGQYANYFDVGVNANELVIDFGQFYGRGTQPTVHTRIVMTAAYGRELLAMLTRSMSELDSHAAAADRAGAPEEPHA